MLLSATKKIGKEEPQHRKGIEGGKRQLENAKSHNPFQIESKIYI